MKKIVSLLMALLLLVGVVCAVTGCSDKKDDKDDSTVSGKADKDEDSQVTTTTTAAPTVSDAEKLIGTWSWQIELGKKMDASEMPEGMDFSSLVMAVTWEIKDDGTITISMTEDDKKALAEDTMDIVLDSTQKMLDEQQPGTKLEDLLKDEATKAQVDQLAGQLAESLSQSMNQLETTGKYKVEGNKLITGDDDNNYFVFSFKDDDTIELKEKYTDGKLADDEMTKKLLPSIMKRK